MRGVYALVCRDRAGRERWRAAASNVICNEGKDAFLDIALGGGTFGTPYFGLIDGSGYTTPPAVGNTMASHAGWSEASFVTARPDGSFTSAYNGTIQVVSPTEVAFSSAGTIKGVFLVIGDGAAADVGDTGGALFSAAVLASGDKTVDADDALTVDYTITTGPVQEPVPLSISGTLSGGTQGVYYSSTLTAAGGTQPYSWGSANLPDGLSINSSTGVVSGTPTTVAIYNPTITVSDRLGATAQKVQSVAIAEAGGGTISEADFIRRRTADGVIRWFDFNVEHTEPYMLNGVLSQIDQIASQKQGGIAPDGYPVAGVGSTGQMPAPWTDTIGWGNNTQRRNHQPYPAEIVQWGPTFDTSVKASGTSSIRQVIKATPPEWLIADPDAGGQTVSGEWWCNFSDDFSVRLGANTEFYVQVRFRLDDTMATYPFVDTGGDLMAGIKIFDIVAANDGLYQWMGGSSGALKMVVIYDLTNDGMVKFYSYPGDAGYYPSGPSGGFIGYQNGDIDTAFCRYPGINSGCWKVRANEWMTMQVGMTLGAEGVITLQDCANWHCDTTWAGYTCWRDSTLKIWATYEGQPTQLILDWNDTVWGYHPIYRPATDPSYPNAIWKWGGITLMNFFTAKSNTQQHPDGNTWYDELIISRQRIPDPPVAGSTNAVLSAIPSGYAKKVGDFSSTYIDGTEFHCSDYSNWQFDVTRNRTMLLGGGHDGTNYEALTCFYLGGGANALTFVEEYPPIPRDWRYESNYSHDLSAWLNGPSTGPNAVAFPHPAARHSEFGNLIVGDQFITLAVVEGDDNANLVGTWADTGGVPGPYSTQTYNTSHHYAHYNCLTHQWKFNAVAQTHMRWMAMSAYASAAYDPVSQRIIIAGQFGTAMYQSGFAIYDPTVDGNGTPTGNIFDVSGSLGEVYPTTSWVRDASGNSLFAPSPGNQLGSYDSLFYYPAHDAFYWVRQDDGKVWRIKPPSGRTGAYTAAQWGATKCTYLGQGPTVNMPQYYAFDSDNGVFGGYANNTFYVFNPTAGGTAAHDGLPIGAWTSRAILGEQPGSEASSPRPIAYSTIDHCYLWFNTYPAGIWAYRW